MGTFLLTLLYLVAKALGIYKDDYTFKKESRS